MGPSKRYEKTTRMSVRIPEELAAQATSVVAKLKKEGIKIDVPGIEAPVKASIAAILLAGFVDELVYWEEVLAGNIEVPDRLSHKVESTKKVDGDANFFAQVHRDESMHGLFKRLLEIVDGGLAGPLEGHPEWHEIVKDAVRVVGRRSKGVARSKKQEREGS